MNKQIHIWLKPEIHRELKIQCAYHGCSVQERVEKLIEDCLLKGARSDSSVSTGKVDELSVAKFLRDFSLFTNVNIRELEELAKVASILNFPKSSYILRESQTPKSFLIIKRGLVKIFNIYPTGKEFIIDIRHDGEMIGEISLIEGGPYLGSAQALENTEIVAIPKDHFIALIGRNQDLISRLFKFEMLEIGNVYGRLINMITGNAPLRVAKVIAFLSLKYGNILRFNHRQIAEMSSTTIETTTRILRTLKEEGIITLSRGTIEILNNRKLQLETEEGIFKPL